jgi:hypothetical protein
MTKQNQPSEQCKKLSKYRQQEGRGLTLRNAEGSCSASALSLGGFSLMTISSRSEDDEGEDGDSSRSEEDEDGDGDEDYLSAFGSGSGSGSPDSREDKWPPIQRLLVRKVMQRRKQGGAAKRATTYRTSRRKKDRWRWRGSACISGVVVVLLVGCGVLRCGRCLVVPCWTFIISRKERRTSGSVCQCELKTREI